MLIAEIHGKRNIEARGSEDYITSAVFGHLRYVPPKFFWGDLFGLAKGMTISNGETWTLKQSLNGEGISISDYSEMKISFWPNRDTYGEPDLWLMFVGNGLRPLLLIIEVKLWSGKSGIGEDDQLRKYMDLLNHRQRFDSNLDSDSLAYLVYLTPHDSLTEIEESFPQDTAGNVDRSRVFRLRWQDITRVGPKCGQLVEPTNAILRDVSEFLQQLGLEYFDGFHGDDVVPLEMFDVEPLNWLGSKKMEYGIFAELELPAIDVQKGCWVQ